MGIGHVVFVFFQTVCRTTLLNSHTLVQLRTKIRKRHVSDKLSWQHRVWVLIWSTTEIIMTLHKNIVLTQLVIYYLNKLINKRQVDDNILFNIVLDKTSALQTVFQKQDWNLQSSRLWMLSRMGRSKPELLHTILWNKEFVFHSY